MSLLISLILVLMVEIGPQAGGQQICSDRPEDEVLFGGKAGPGKSWWLVYDALGTQYRFTSLGRNAIEVPDYRAVIFRRQSNHLQKLIDEAYKMYCSSTFKAEYVAQRKGDPGPSFIFPTYTRKGDTISTTRSGAVIFFCHMDQEKDKFNHDGAEYQFVGFDELQQFTFGQYIYLFTRARSKVLGLNPRIRSTAMPMGTGLVWVRKRFIQNSEPYRRYSFLADPDDPERNPRGLEVPYKTKYSQTRIFIPGNLEDNKFVLKDDYRSKIKQQGETVEKALLEGDWYAFGGDFFKMFDPAKSKVKPFPIPEEWPLIGGLDPGWSSPCAFTLRTVDFEGNHYKLFTYYEREKSSRDHAKSIAERLKNFEWTAGRMPNVIVSGTDAWARKDRFAVESSEETFRDQFEKEGLSLEKAVTDRVNGWWAMKNLMEAGRYFYFDTFNEPFLDEIAASVADEKNPEDILGKGKNPDVVAHALDADRYSIMAARGYSKPPEEPKTWMDRLKKKQNPEVPEFKVGRG